MYMETNELMQSTKKAKSPQWDSAYPDNIKEHSCHRETTRDYEQY
jgi:hypothetical protein